MNRRIPARTLPVLALFILGLTPAGLSAAAPPAPRPTPTPTHRPRLSGGFGRTPVPPPARAEAPPAPAATEAGEPAESSPAPPPATPKKEAASPKEKTPKGVAITNESLVKDPNRGRLSTSQIRPPTPPPAISPAPGGRALEAPAAAAAPAATAGDEAVWRERARSARRRVEELKTEITQLEADAKQLETDFYRWDDGQYRDRVIKPSWDKKREDLETRRRQLVDAEAELADLPERARKAGALPGWLRE
ncbi:MAG: hypothetical protein M3167_04765 [Acidobacteriota bacterium]|nr:hypothetical protein [Acidobacteriota bacterium]